MSASPFRGRRVLVTGHTGFKGSWLCHWLERMGANVAGLGLAPDDPSHFRVAPPSVDSRLLDIRNAEAVDALLSEVRPEIVFHLAAQPLVRRSHAEPRETYEVNLLGTLNLYEASRRAGVRALVSVTTDKVYADADWVWAYREVDPLGGADPYSSSKACVEILTSAYRASYLSNRTPSGGDAMLLATARAGNVIGGGDWGADRLLPDMIRAVGNGEPVALRNPASVRPWQHVLDALGGYLILGARLFAGETAAAAAWNFGPPHDEDVTVGALAAMAADRWPGLAFRLATAEGPEPVETHALRLDPSKAQRLLGWQSVWSLRKSLDRTIGWYREFLESGRVLTGDDLDAYSRDLKERSPEMAAILE